MRDRRLPLWLLPLVLLATSPTHAHGIVGSSAPFWSGVFHVLVAPMAVATVVGFTAAIAFVDDRTVLLSMGSAALAAFAAVLWAPSSWSVLTPLGAIAAGLLAVVASHTRRWLYVLIAFISGAATGVAADPDVRSWSVAFGVAVTILLIASCGIETLLWLRQRPRLQSVAEIGRRVLGAWTAAIGLLLGALLVFGAAI